MVEDTRTENPSFVFLLLLSQVTTSMDFSFLFLVSLQIHWPLDWLWLFGGLALWSWQLLPNVFWVYGILSQDQSCYFLLLNHTYNFKGFPLSLRKSCLPGSLFCLMLTEALKLSLRLLIQFSVHASLSHTHPFPFNLRWAKARLIFVLPMEDSLNEPSEFVDQCLSPA